MTKLSAYNELARLSSRGTSQNKTLKNLTLFNDKMMTTFKKQAK